MTTEQIFYIRMENGQPFEHPIIKKNIASVWPWVNFNDLPENLKRFERIPAPEIDVYEIAEGPVYILGEDDVVRDTWTVRSMTEEEKIEKQNFVKEEWKNNGFNSWTFNELTCAFEPPTPKPNDGKDYRWDESTLSWVEFVKTE